jgi:hypothetical protein
LGFAGAFRRSELVALNVADLEETEDGLKITIRRSKTDQEGHGETIAIIRGGVACPVKAVKAWMQAAAITEGPPSPRAAGSAFSGSRARACAILSKPMPRSSDSRRADFRPDTKEKPSGRRQETPVAPSGDRVIA